MKGTQIRSWAWNRAKEGRGLLVTVALTGLAAGLPGTIAGRLLREAAWPLREGVHLPLQLIGALFQLGVLYVMLRAAQGQEVEFKQITTPFHREWLKKAVLFTLIYTLAATLLQLGPNLLALKGRELMAAAQEAEALKQGQWIQGLGYGLDVLLVLLLAGIWFPVEYLLFLAPEKTAGQVLKEGLALGLRSLGRIIVFHFWLALPLLLPLFLVLLAGETGGVRIMVLLSLLWLGLLVWVTPYVYLAQAGLALNLLGKRPKGTGKKKGK